MLQFFLVTHHESIVGEEQLYLFFNLCVLKGAGGQRQAIAAFPPGTIPVTNFTDGWVVEKKISYLVASDLMNFGLQFSLWYL